ncbi:unnamed protein product [Caenorhabditis auriculariae]|uniref:Rubicon Homology domain-containing protein n=1 Tax=Caenorhabditis auriculariae TaxID=2777116 RepID=A0A8S1HQN4_9PELO|nr:unnamed protein product [Caenorhabditis auriculariae]
MEDCVAPFDADGSMKWFGRRQYQPVNGCAADDSIEVDRISFASNSSEDEEPPPLISFTPPSSQPEMFGAASSALPLQPQILLEGIPIRTESGGSGSQYRGEDLLTDSAETEPGSFSRQSSIRYATPCAKGQLFDSEKSELPSVLRTSLFWYDEDEVPEMSEPKVSARHDEEVDDNKMAVLCRSIQASIGLMERTRWYNTVSRDPILSSCVSSMDPEFPIAILRPDETEGCSIGLSQSTSTIGESNASLASSHGDDFWITRVPARLGIDAIELVRKKNDTVESICSAVLNKHFSQDRPRDKRIRKMVPQYCNVSSWIGSLGPNVVKSKNTMPQVVDDWVLKVHKVPNVRVGLEAQQSRCANCGAFLSATHNAKTASEHGDMNPRFCEYFGLFFCSLCHGGEKSILPGKIILAWNFSESFVCDKALRFLKGVREMPVLHIRELSPELIAKNKALRAVIEIREKLKHMEQFIKICAQATEYVTEHGNLSTMFASLDRYLLESSDVFSLNDLLRVYNKDLINHLEPLARFSRTHISNCEDCWKRGHVCIRCNKGANLFPFEDRVFRCGVCGALSHLPKCPNGDAMPPGSACPKCARNLRNRARQRIVGEMNDF